MDNLYNAESLTDSVILYIIFKPLLAFLIKL